MNATGFPELARKRAIDAITDCAACMLAGARQPLAGAVARAIPTFEHRTGAASAALVGAARYASPLDAALFNGAVAHALDYDDTNHPAYAHPSAVIAPVLMAVAATEPVTGSDLISAYIVGLEVFGKLGRVLNRGHYKRGWHATATFGTLAASMVAGRLLRLDQRAMEMAIGIAASSAGGLRVNFGSMVKPLHSGYAARNGLLAALLAREGLESSIDTLDHRYGYFALFANEGEIDPQPFQHLGESLEILSEYGLALKPYPSCGATHPGIEAAIALHEQLRGQTIRSVRAGVCEMAFEPLIYVGPHDSLQGKFSMHYCLAVGLLDGKVNLDSFTMRRISDPAIIDLIPKIVMETDERIRHDGEFATILTVVTEDGRVHERFVPLAMGKPARWLSREQLKAKFDDCLGESKSSASRDAVFDSLQSLDREEAAAAMFEILYESRFSTEANTASK
ncbi:MmgE/PrpD family protein [Caballeronia sp. 15715]